MKWFVSLAVSMAAAFARFAIIIAAKMITGAKALGQVPSLDTYGQGRVYIANHTSHGDFVLLWASLHPKLRARVRPVAGADYWQAGPLRRFIIHHVFNGVLIARQPRSEPSKMDPLQPLLDALHQGDSLIFFPEGTRNLAEPDPQLGYTPLLAFKSGLFHLLHQVPHIPCVPVWIANLNRVMPKGRTLPLPLLCTLNFAPPLLLQQDEGKKDFLQRAEQALLGQAPREAQ
ncbi:lysophospholipid acyltransferase family protein [Motilimonas sp. KMU-193]|uniref:lysophospholipid acyltransferase family protein n=1 Tax=Motilimonas sp. KMU-193 TaxID=3388668 RepID=UPI00396B37F8